jgi:phytoene synthase
MPMRSPDPRRATPADRAACRRKIRTGSKSFAAASLLLPPGLREASTALYAFCRLSDDLVDEEGGAAEAIADLRDRLARAYAGCPADDPVDRAFADMVARFALPYALPEALIDGLAWDVEGVVCEDFGDLCAYAARVAGSVGAMMTVLMGERDPVMLARACDLGVAMQLTNIARDVGEDARAGRLYLPRSWLREQGVDPEVWLRHPDFTAAIGRVVARLLSLAEELYERADSGIRGLPATCRPAIFAARHIYREIGQEVARRGFDSVSVRARVSGARKIALIGRALGRAVTPRAPASGAPPLAETAYLVQAAAQPAGLAAAELGPIAGRILWVAQLFAALDARQRPSRGQA